MKVRNTTGRFSAEPAVLRCDFRIKEQSAFLPGSCKRSRCKENTVKEKMVDSERTFSPRKGARKSHTPSAI